MPSWTRLFQLPLCAVGLNIIGLWLSQEFLFTQPWVSSSPPRISLSWYMIVSEYLPVFLCWLFLLEHQRINVITIKNLAVIALLTAFFYVLNTTIIFFLMENAETLMKKLPQNLTMIISILVKSFSIILMVLVFSLVIVLKGWLDRSDNRYSISVRAWFYLNLLMIFLLFLSLQKYLSFLFASLTFSYWHELSFILDNQSDYFSMTVIIGALLLFVLKSQREMRALSIAKIIGVSLFFVLFTFALGTMLPNSIMSDHSYLIVKPAFNGAVPNVARLIVLLFVGTVGGYCYLKWVFSKS